MPDISQYCNQRRRDYNKERAQVEGICCLVHRNTDQNYDRRMVEWLIWGLKEVCLLDRNIKVKK